MRLALKPHPFTPCDAITRIDVEVTRPDPATLHLHYVLTGDLTDLRLPSVTAPARADELWRHTCFEAFVQPLPGRAYYEFNFSPSTRWAAYGFDAYRAGKRDLAKLASPAIKIQSKDGAFELRARLRLDGLAGVPSDAAWRLGLAAVIEEAIGSKSYWALAHPPGRPDFHHSDCFALEIPAANSL